MSSESDTLNNFIPPENGQEVTTINYTLQGDFVTPKEIEACLVACPNVETLNLCWKTGEESKDKSNKIFGEVIAAIATYGKNMITLRIESDALIDEHFKNFSYKTLPALRKLAIPYSREFGALGIKYMADQCPDLTTLHIPYTLYNHSNEAAFYIGRFLPNLKKLNMHRTCKMLDSGLSAIAEGCPRLEDIQVGRNYDITDESLKAMSKNCPELVSLGMYYNDKITPKGLQYIVDGCPKFKNFYHGMGWSNIKAIHAAYSKFPSVNFS